jgi:hypothetical protein
MKSRFSHKKNRKDTNEKKWEPELRERKTLHKTRVEEKDKREKKEEWNVGNTLPLINDYAPHQQVALFKRLWRTWQNATFGDQRRPRAPPKHDKPLHILARATHAPSIPYFLMIFVPAFVSTSIMVSQSLIDLNEWNWILFYKIEHPPLTKIFLTHRKIPIYRQPKQTIKSNLI